MVTLTGNSGPNTLDGTNGDDTLSGLAGDDSLSGFDGNDLLEGGDDNDTLFGGLGQDTLQGGDGDDNLNGTNEFGFDTDPLLSDELFGGEGNDTLNGYGSNSMLFGGPGDDILRGGPDGLNDTLDGGPGADDMVGQAGNDTYYVDDPGDSIGDFGSASDIDIIFSSISYALNDGSTFDIENLTLLGTGNTSATGNSLGNEITGNSGDNTITGAAGDDTLTGGDGADSFVLTPTGGNDRITDFEFGVDQLSASGFTQQQLANVVLSEDIDGNRVITVDGLTSVTLVGIPLNFAPTFTSIPPITTNEDAAFSYTITASDLDGDTISLDPGASTLPSWASFSGATIVGAPEQGDVGILGNDFSILIRDSSGNETTQMFTVEVLNVNDDPFFDTVAQTVATEDVLYTYQVIVSDEDGDIPTVDLGSLTTPAWLTYDAPSLTFSGTPTQADVGTAGNDVSITFTDGLGGSATQTFTIDVANVNDDPVFTSLPQEMADQGSLYTYTPTFTDPDGDTPTIDLPNSVLPAWLTFDPLTGAFSGTPQQEDVGTTFNDVTIAISDGLGGTASQMFTIDVANVNDDPVFTSLAQETANEGSLFSYTPTFTDPDGDLPTVDLPASTLPTWLTFDPLTGTFSGTPQQADVGTHGNDLIVAITDGNGGNATQSFLIEVLNANDAPTGDVVINGTLAVGETLTADTGALMDGDGLGTFSFQWQVDGIDISGATSSTYQLTAQDLGNITVVVSYTDGGGTPEIVTSLARSFTDLVITGTPGPDPLNGFGGNETLIGLEGNDTLDGGPGVDQFEGGPGDDVFLIDDPTEVIIELAGEGTDTVQTSIGFVLPDNVEALELLGGASVNGTGNSLDNLLQANDGNNALSGLAGDDTLFSAEGLDTLIGGAGNDIYLLTNTEADIVELQDDGLDFVIADFSFGLGAHLEGGELVGTNPGSIIGNTQDNALIGNSAQNLLFGSAGDDTLIGEGDTDALFDGDGIDSLVGGEGSDIYFVGETGDIIEELAGQGTDLVLSYAPEYALPDNVENLLLSDLGAVFFEFQNALNLQSARAEPDVQSAQNNDLQAVALGGFRDTHFYDAETRNIWESVPDRKGAGNALDNVIEGDKGDNILSGLGGNDTIDGGAGLDQMFGDAGSDVFRYSSFDHGGVGFFESDLIADFVRGEDKIDLSGLIISQGKASFNDTIGGLETRGFTFLGENSTTGVAGQISAMQLGDLVGVTVDNGSETGTDLSFFVSTDGPLSESDFILSPLDTDRQITQVSDGEQLDFSSDDTTTVTIDEDFSSSIGVNYSFGDVFRIKAGYDQPDLISDDEFDGRLGGSAGNGVFTDTSFAPGDSPDDGSFILGATFRFFRKTEFESSEPGTPSSSLALEIDRNLDGVADFDLVLFGDYRGAQFRTELVNGDINISLFEGNSDPTGTLTIDGDLDVFEEVSVNTDNLFDRDGIDLSTAQFQWFNNGEEIAGETDGEYRLRLSDIGDVINVQLTYTDMFGTQETVMSQTAGPVPAVDRPATGDVLVTGTAQQGETLAIDVSDIRDPDVPDPRTSEYQWLRNGSEIDGATQFDYTLTQEDVGQAISVRFTIKDLGGATSTFTSAATGAVENINDPADGAVTVSGIVGRGETVTADLSGITDPDGVSNIAQSVQFQWLRNGAEIGGATSQDYLLVSEDVNELISVRVDFEDDTGAAETLTSAEKLGLGSSSLIEGTPGPDILRSQTGQDTIFGFEGDDSITSSFGDDMIDGGPGTDRAIFGGHQRDFTVVLSPTGVTVEDRKTDPFSNIGTKFLTDVEQLDFLTEVDAFGGNPVNLTQFGNVANLNEDDFSEFIELYIAYFNRAPDAIGLFFWGSQFAAGFSLEEIATLFFNQEETRATYPDLSNVEEFAKQVYSNVLGRDFDEAGLNFWVSVLSNGSVSLPTFMLEIIRGAKAPPQPGDSPELTAQKLIDVAYLTNKTDLGAYFSVIKGMSDVDNARSAMEFYDGSQASIDFSKDRIDDFFDDALGTPDGEFLFQLTGVVEDPFAVF